MKKILEMKVKRGIVMRKTEIDQFLRRKIFKIVYILADTKRIYQFKGSENGNLQYIVADIENRGSKTLEIVGLFIRCIKSSYYRGSYYLALLLVTIVNL